MHTGDLMPQRPQCTQCGGLPAGRGQLPAQGSRADLQDSTGSALGLLWGEAVCQHILGPGSATASCLPSFTQTAYEEQAHPTSPHPNSGPGRHSPLYQGSPTPSSIPSPNPSCRIVSKKPLSSECRPRACGSPGAKKNRS